MRRGSFLINVARGNIVVQSELIDALRAGTIAGAMLDVFEREPLPHDSPLWEMPNVIATPPLIVIRHKLNNHTSDYYIL